MEQNEPLRRLSRRRERKLVDAVSAAVLGAHVDPAGGSCPDTEELRRIAARDPGIDDSPDVVGHIATCAACFSVYSAYRDAVERRTRAWRYAVAAACILVTGVVIGLRKEPAQSVAESPTVARKESVVRAEPIAMAVDLGAYSPTRSANSRERSLRLPAKLLRLTVRLPVGLEPGSYQCRLMSGRSILLEQSVRADLAEGVVAFPLDIDLRSGSRQQLVFMIRPPGLSWRSYAITIQEEP